MIISVAGLQAAQDQSSGVVWLGLVTVSHPEIATPLRFAIKNNESVVSNGDTYLALFGDIILTSQQGDQVPEARIRLDAIGYNQVIVDALEGLNPPRPTLDLVYVLSSDLDTAIAENLGMELVSATITVEMLDARLSGPGFLNETVPGLSMNKQTCPGLF